MTKQEKIDFRNEYQDQLIEYGIENEIQEMKLSSCSEAVIINGWCWEEKWDGADLVLDYILEEKDLSVEQIIELLGGE